MNDPTVSKRYSKEDILTIAEELHQEGMAAKASYSLIMLYGEVSKKYQHEMNISPAFFNIVYSSLQSSCFMDVAKLFDTSSKAIGIRKLIDICNENISLFPKIRKTGYHPDGTKYEIPYYHVLKPEEEQYYPEYVEKERSIQSLFSPEQELPIRKDFTFEEFLTLYKIKFSIYDKKRKNLREQRNKIYAHNDSTVILDYASLIKSHPIYYDDLKEMIDYALDVTSLVIGALTQVVRATEYDNIDDLENILYFAKIGWEQQEKKWEDEGVLKNATPTKE